MAKVTKIKAKEANEAEKTQKAKAQKAEKDEKAPKVQKAQKAPKAEKAKKPLPKPLRIITAPFRAIGRYIHNSWLELRHVRWPSHKATWKMVLAVFVYAGLIMAIIMLLDALFTWLFNLILG